MVRKKPYHPDKAKVRSHGTIMLTRFCWRFQRGDATHQFFVGKGTHEGRIRPGTMLLGIKSIVLIAVV